MCECPSARKQDVGGFGDAEIDVVGLANNLWGTVSEQEP